MDGEGSSNERAHGAESLRSLVAAVEPRTHAHPTLPLPGATRQTVLPSRYVDLGVIGSGGMGQVRRAKDNTMNRVVAIKVMHWEHVRDTPTLTRFRHEARIMAGLQHPGIIPVHDQGNLPDGRPWFSMQEVRGRTLSDVIRMVHDDENEARRQRRVRQLVSVVHRMAETVAFAHASGVVHRDIKPGNLMVGEFGEALVMDWGLARRIDESDNLDERSRGAVKRIVGTPAYMAPEQAKGDVAGPEADIFALGLVLIEVLTGRPINVIRATEHVRPFLKECGTLGAEGLHAIAARALAIPRPNRFPNGTAIAEQLQAWLDGEGKRQRALILFDGVREHDPARLSLRTDLAAATSKWRSLQKRLLPHDDASKKLHLWRVEDQVLALRNQLDALERSQLERLQFALRYDPNSEVIREALVTLAREKLEDARANNSKAEEWRGLLRIYDGSGQIDSLAHLSLQASKPSIACVQPYRMRDRRWVLGESTHEVSTPFEDLVMEPGPYRLTLRSDGCTETVLPVVVDDGQRYDLGRVRMLRASALGPDDCHVPAGPVWLGGDELAPEAFPREQVHVDGFIMRRFPVTNGEYLTFLNALVDQDQADNAERYAPRLQSAAASEGVEPLAFTRNASGYYELAPDEFGRSVKPDWPVALIDWHSARAYAVWHARRTGKPWRLPTEFEWEKAARGADGRAYPWGDQAEPTWACMLGSSEDTPQREAIDGHPNDESPYGVRGLAGNVRDWCLDVWTRMGTPRIDGWAQVPSPQGDSTLRVIRGGAWNAVPTHARAAGRFAATANTRFPVVGFRLARSLMDSDD